MTYQEYIDKCLRLWWSKLGSDGCIDVWSKVRNSYGESMNIEDPKFRRLLIDEVVPKNFPACVPLWYFTMTPQIHLVGMTRLGIGFRVGLINLNDQYKREVDAGDIKEVTCVKAEFIDWVYITPHSERTVEAISEAMRELIEIVGEDSSWDVPLGHDSAWEAMECGCKFLVPAESYDTTPPGLQGQFGDKARSDQWTRELILEAASEDLETVKMDMVLEYYRVIGASKEETPT